MERDFLEKQGLNADQIKAVMAQNGKETNALRDDYDRKLASLNDQIDGYKSQVTDRDKQIKSLSTAAKDNEELRAKFALVGCQPLLTEVPCTFIVMILSWET